MADKEKFKKAEIFLTSVKQCVQSPLSLAIGSLLAVFLIILNIGMSLMNEVEYGQYLRERALIQELRDFIIGNDEKLSKASDEVLLSLIPKKTAVLLENKKAVKQVKTETRGLRELTSGIIGHGHLFYHTLFYIPKKTATFDEAIQECAKINATLVSVKTLEEQRFINDMVHKQRSDEHWIGAYRSHKTKYKWTWIDKNIIYQKEYWNTKGNHPRQQRYFDDGPNCVANTKQCEDFQLGIWNRCWEDRKCSDYYHFICRLTKNEHWV